jgi:hypothetical protein
MSKTNTKRAGGVAHAVGPEFKAQYHKNKKNVISILVVETMDEI